MKIIKMKDIREIEDGTYSFRASATTCTGEQETLYSYSVYVESNKELLEAMADAIKNWEYRKYTNININAVIDHTKQARDMLSYFASNTKKSDNTDISLSDLNNSFILDL